MRGLFILGGSELIEQFHVVIYLLGGALIVLAVRIWRGVSENVDPDRNLMVRAVRRIYPVTSEFHGGHWFVRKDHRRYATPLFLCLAAIVFADLAFAIDSIPAAFAITRDPLLIWMGNVFALLGMRALFVLVESLVARFRYLDETIAIVLGLVGVKLLIEDIVKIGPVASLAGIAVAFTVGIAPLGARRPARSRRRAAPQGARRGDAFRERICARPAGNCRPLELFEKFLWRISPGWPTLARWRYDATDGSLVLSLRSPLGRSHPQPAQRQPPSQTTGPRRCCTTTRRPARQTTYGSKAVRNGRSRSCRPRLGGRPSTSRATRTATRIRRPATRSDPTP